MSPAFGPVFLGVVTQMFLSYRAGHLLSKNWYEVCRRVTFSNETYQLIRHHAS
jgi:hypothetical protein